MLAHEALEPVTRQAELCPCVDHGVAQCSPSLSLSMGLEVGEADSATGGGTGVEPGFVQINAANDFIQVNAANDFIQIS